MLEVTYDLRDDTDLQGLHIKIEADNRSNKNGPSAERNVNGEAHASDTGPIFISTTDGDRPRIYTSMTGGVGLTACTSTPRGRSNQIRS
jgi:hypothetical protein